MPTTSVESKDLSSRFNELIASAAAGNEVIVTENQVPVARLVPLLPGMARVPGLHAGMIQISADFDDPLPDDFWLGES